VVQVEHWAARRTGLLRAIDAVRYIRLNSQYTCYGLWMQDFRVLMDWPFEFL
jgi:hypothetical protein